MGQVPSHLDVKVKAGPAGPVLSLAGDLDVTTVALLRQAAAEAFDEHTGPQLSVDAGQLEFCDSVGIASLVKLREQCDQLGWTLHVSDVQPYVRRVLQLTGLTEYLNAG
jgi:anti-anti-sigma factor